MSCTSSTACIAVGYDYNHSTGALLTLAERWNGTSWSSQATPTPMGASSSSLGGVSCTSSTACTAVGYYITAGEVAFAERWNGTSWSIQTIPNPDPTGSSWLSGVSCASSTACTAVGGYYNAAGTEVTFAESSNGTSWSIQTTVNPTGASGSSLSAVSCTSTTACTAVGSDAVNGGTLTLAESWNGTTWSIQTTPNPTGSELSAVSCSSTAACTAVGSSPAGALAERWDGTSWSIEITPNPSSRQLAGVSCTSSSACSAVGYSSGVGGTYTALAERWNATNWSIQTTPNGTGALPSALDGVSCASSTACTAVGYYSDPTGTGGTLAERWNGASWSIQTTPNPNGSSALYGVSCASSTACIAVGAAATSSNSSGVLAESWNGTIWSIQATPIPNGSSDSRLSGVSCASSTACTAVGYYYNDSGVLTLAERWNGTSWSIQTTPNVGDASFSQLNGVSCTSSTACTAVGDYYSNSSGTGGTLVERWNGTSWSIQATPNLMGPLNSLGLNGVSCTLSMACTAVGSYSNSTLADSWNGTTWSIQATPNPTGSYYSQLSEVSCVSSTACTAVGFYTHSNPLIGGTLAENWNGTTWSIQTTPNPTGASSIQLDGVSCTSSAACTAVGSYDGGSVPFVERYS